MKKEMLINVLQPEECRIAIVEDGVLEELYVERTSLESYTGNIYKGKVVNLEPAIQAAFVDFSVGRNGFLHVSDVEPQYYRRHAADVEPAPPREREPRRDRPDRGADRPDRSDRGRRDRGEARRFGEGLVEDLPPAPATAPISPPPPARHEPPRVESPRVEAERVEAERVEAEPFRRARAPQREPISDPVEPARGYTPAPRGREAEPLDVEADLPPSRSQRPRPAAPAPAAPAMARTIDPDIEDLIRPRTPARGEDAEAAPPAREPRRRGGRGRTPRPAPEPEPAPEPAFDEPEVLAAPAIEPETDDAPEPRRRGGRDAIRSRGGDRERLPARAREVAAEPPPREREREPRREFGADLGDDIDLTVPPPAAARARPRAVEPERPRAAPPERARPVEPERTRAPEPERTRAPEPERTRARSPERVREPERSKPHDRAGEPGYVPRSLRSRGLDPAAEPAGPPPASIGWRDEDDIPDIEGDPEDIESRGEEGGESEADRGDGTRRRRRRRGRRRDRNDRDPAAAAPASPGVAPRAVDDQDEDDLDDLEVDDLEPEVARTPAPAPASRRGARPAPPAAAPASVPDQGPDEVDDFDFGDEDDDEDEFDDEAVAEGRELGEPADPEDEIDPELEEEIRREIEEIAELEREMGLRGPVEARPRGGDRPAAAEPAGRGRSPRGRVADKPPLQEIFRRGDEVLVQVIKESIGTKGPTLSTYISIPGRYLVLMPGLNRVGVSRKIADERQRRKLRDIMNELNPPKGLGFIVRTAGLDRSKRDLARDLAYLLRLWKVILRRIKQSKGPTPIYQESDMITRTIRDIFNAEIDTIWIDEPAAFERAQEFLRVVMPRFVGRLKLYSEKVPLFHKYGIEEEIAKIQRRHVPLPEGGSIVIDQTEALVAIDVNSGNFRVENDAERTAYEMNLRAAKEIARQLRLRDLGGVICNDFIDMRDERNCRNVERALRDAVKRDRARTKVLRMSQFGIIEMTRQRIRPSLKRSVYEDCTNCTGVGQVKTVESMSIDVMRLLALASHREDIRRINMTVAPAVATHLNNRKRVEIARLEADGNLSVHIRPEEGAPAEHLQVDCFDANNGEVRLLPAPAPTHTHRRGR